jgi:ABC-type dipeptide/oligopeptide/nickel transport system permease component
MATLQALLLVVANLLTDLLYAWADPRVELR